MRDSKSLLLLLVSLLLVLVSFGLLWTWGYRFYNKNDAAIVETRTVSLDSVAIANNIRDSLQSVYNSTLHELDVQLDSTLANTDSLKNELDIKLGEFYRLRNEITAILKNRNAGNDFKVAKQKIGELQNKVQDFRDKTAVVENENKKLNAILTQLDNSGNTATNTTQPVANNNKLATERSNTAYQVFTASDLKFFALSVNNDDETETNSAESTDKLSGSFTVMNFNSQLTNAEMVVVVLQPNGRVFKTSGWESGTFNTPDGKKVYSYKINFNYTKGEAKRLLFSLKAANLMKGNYTMEIYYNGSMIARTVKNLS
ncbi:MAG: hypothetical protein ABIO79_09925 [Ferruginibacter sp.]